MQKHLDIFKPRWLYSSVHKNVWYINREVEMEKEVQRRPVEGQAPI